MMSIQYISFEDHQSFDGFEFRGGDYFDLNVNLTLGDEKGGDNFYFYITNDYDSSCDEIVIEDYEIYFRKKGVFVMKCFDKQILLDFIKSLIKDKGNNQNPSEVSTDLSEYFHWEFDNYVPYKD